MKGQIKRFCFYLFLTVFLSGCGTPVLVGGIAAVTAASGTYIYLGGELRTDHNAGFDRTWDASERTVAQMRGVNVVPHKEIGHGRITAVINDERVTITVKYKSRTQTTVGVRVGTMGDRRASQLIHDMIADHITKS